MNKNSFSVIWKLGTSASSFELYPTPHFVPEGISYSMKDSNILVLISTFFPEENSYENLNKRQVTNSEIPSNQSKQESNSISGRNYFSLEEHCSNIDFSDEIVRKSLASERQTVFSRN